MLMEDLTCHVLQDDTASVTKLISLYTYTIYYNVLNKA